VSVDLAGTRIPFISGEDLIVTKLLAGREKDIEDVRGVLSARGASLDLARILETLRLLEDAVGQRDLTPAFERELARWQQSGR
jgi:predicted nucleotidyltransferase